MLLFFLLLLLSLFFKAFCLRHSLAPEMLWRGTAHNACTALAPATRSQLCCQRRRQKDKRKRRLPSLSVCPSFCSFFSETAVAPPACRRRRGYFYAPCKQSLATIFQGKWKNWAERASFISASAILTQSLYNNGRRSLVWLAKGTSSLATLPDKRRFLAARRSPRQL